MVHQPFERAYLFGLMVLRSLRFFGLQAMDAPNYLARSWRTC